MMIASTWIQMNLMLIMVFASKAVLRGSSDGDSCSAGTFINSTGGCESCPMGQYQPESAQTSCLKCPKGTEQRSTGQTDSSSCKDCKVGWVATAEGSKFCSECPPGTFTNVTRTKDCYKCEPGTHNNSTGKGKCDLCPPGTYQDESEMADCKPCSDGRYNDQWGKVSCKPCAGTTSADNTACYAVCQAGSHRSESECKSCTPGTYQNDTNADKCLDCPPGHYQGESGSTRCSLCDPQFYQNKSGQTKCLPCPSGTTAKTEGSAKCEDDESAPENQCRAGYHSNTGMEPCQPCQIGTYSAVRGGTSCVHCPAGTATQSTGSKRCEECSKRMCAFEGECFGCSSSIMEKCLDENSGFHEGGIGFCNTCTYQCKDNSYLFSVAGVSITIEIMTIFCGSFIFLLSFCIFLSCWRYKKRRNKVSSLTKIKQNSSPSKSQLIITIRSLKLDHLPLDLDF